MSGTYITSVRMPVALARQLQAEAERQDRSQNWVICKALEVYLARRKS